MFSFCLTVHSVNREASSPCLGDSGACKLSLFISKQNVDLDTESKRQQNRL